MKRPPSRALLLSVALLAVAPALGQDAPKSLLPPGFGEAPAPTPPPTAPRATPPAAQGDAAVPDVPLTLSPADLTNGGVTEVDVPDSAGTGDEEDDAEAPAEAQYDVPDHARRPVDGVGPLGTGPYSLGADAFGRADGRYLSTLLRRMQPPLASRWAHILLRRGLLTATATPAGVEGADWVAERAWLLLRMGEADAARMLVNSVDVDRFTPKLLTVATQTALANADPAALCPLTAIAATMSQEPIWPMARAMCTAFGGEAGAASAAIDRLRHARVARGIDLLLADKTVGAGVGGRRSVAIAWNGVDRLTSWRFGIASALAVPIPEPLFDTVGPHVRAWAARAPMVTPEARVGAARAAAALGVFSNATLVDLYATIADRIDVSDLGGTDAGRLRAAYAGGDPAARMTALRALWTAQPTSRDGYAADILTARAAGRMPADAAFAADAPRLIAAMFAAGLDVQAARWSSVVAAQSGVAADVAWAMLAVGTPETTVDLSSSRIDAFVESGGGGGPVKSRLLVAALAGLGRMGTGDRARLGQATGIDFGAANPWTRAIDRAAADGQPGTVAILAATGLQSGSWIGVPPLHLYHLLAALRRVGLDSEARMIAAEAMSRT